MVSTFWTKRRALWQLGLAVISILCLDAINARAQDAAPRELTLLDCYLLAREHQPALHAAQISLSSSEKGLASIPKGLFSKEIPIRRSQASLGISIAAAALKQAEWETHHAVTWTYYSVLYARSQEALLEDVVDALREGHRNAEHLVKNDPKTTLTTTDVDTIKIHLAKYESKLEEAKIGGEKAKAALREAMGVKRNFNFDVSKSDTLPALVESVDLETLLHSAIERRPEIHQARLALGVTELEVSAQASRRIKKRVMTFAMGADIHSRAVPQGTINGEYRPGAIGIEVPSMLFGKRGARVDRASDIAHRTEYVVEKTENLVMLEVEVTYLKWKQAAGQIKTLQGSLKLAEKLALTQQDRFKVGAITGDEFVRAQALRDQTQAEYNEAVYHHALALAGLQRATAGGFRLPRKDLAAAE